MGSGVRGPHLGTPRPAGFCPAPWTSGLWPRPGCKDLSLGVPSTNALVYEDHKALFFLVLTWIFKVLGVRSSWKDSHSHGHLCSCSGRQVFSQSICNSLIYSSIAGIPWKFSIGFSAFTIICFWIRFHCRNNECQICVFVQNTGSSRAHEAAVTARARGEPPCSLACLSYANVN